MFLDSQRPKACFADGQETQVHCESIWIGMLILSYNYLTVVCTK